ncbi:hypothetical protein MNBD_GAMMA12-1435 [hydrothermal vent metagenome]|uniref:Histone-like bacterial DNA-binding protein n=1 Tax=hydrothermal vent metagenome TaxID=652676 RepID=A0A3B0XSK6_9ZZZZ
MAAKKKVTATTEKKVKAIKSKMTKSEILNELSEKCDLSKKQIAGIFDELAHLINRHIKKGGAGEFAFPGLMKIKAVKKKPQPAKKNHWVPLLKEFRDIPAKPASIRVKVTPLKALKEMVK